MPEVQKIQWRRGTAAEWTTTNPVLSEGTPGFEKDTGKFKIGDGVKDWKTLAYANASPAALTEVANKAALPAAGEAGKLYVAKDTGELFRWDGAKYVDAGASSFGAALSRSADAAAARKAISATSSKVVITAESLGIPTDGVTDAAPIINALPQDTGMIHFSGTLLCKTPLVLKHGTSLVGTGRGYSAGSSIIKFDPTQSWGSNPKLLTLGDGTNICFATRVMNAVIDCCDIPGSIGVYSCRVNEQSGLFNVLIFRAVHKGLFVEGGVTPGEPAQNWGVHALEVTMSATATPTSIGIDVDGGHTVVRDLSDITVTVDKQTYVNGLTGMRLNAVSAGAVRDCHFENLTTGLLIGDEQGCNGLTVDNVHGHANGTDLVVIGTPSKRGQNYSFNFTSIVGMSGQVNLLQDKPRGRVYTAAGNAYAGGYYRIGNNGPDAALPVETNMVEAAGLLNNHRPVTTLELGHVSDTTLTRSAAGVLAVEGVVIPSVSSTNTLTNKTIDNATLTGTPTVTAGNILRFPHAKETSIYDGSITVGTYAEGLNIVGSQTVAGGGQKITLYGAVQTETKQPYSVKVSVPATATVAGKPGQWACDATAIYTYTGDGTTHTWVKATAATW